MQRRSLIHREQLTAGFVAIAILGIAAYMSLNRPLADPKVFDANFKSGAEESARLLGVDLKVYNLKFDGGKGVYAGMATPDPATLIRSADSKLLTFTQLSDGSWSGRDKAGREKMTLAQAGEGKSVFFLNYNGLPSNDDTVAEGKRYWNSLKTQPAE